MRHYYVIATRFSVVRLEFIGDCVDLIDTMLRLFLMARDCSSSNESATSMYLTIARCEEVGEWYKVNSNVSADLFVVSREKVLWTIYEAVDGAILDKCPVGLCRMHSALVVNNDAAVAFMGVSRSGKSTLALEFKKRGYAIADEHVWLDYHGGRVYGEHLPLHLRSGSIASLLSSNEPQLVRIASPNDDPSFLLPLKKGTIGGRLRSIVFPRYDADACENLSLTKSGQLPEMLLMSCDSNESPSRRLMRVLGMLQEYDVSAYELDYSDSKMAVDLLLGVSVF